MRRTFATWLFKPWISAPVASNDFDALRRAVTPSSVGGGRALSVAVRKAATPTCSASGSSTTGVKGVPRGRKKETASQHGGADLSAKRRQSPHVKSSLPKRAARPTALMEEDEEEEYNKSSGMMSTGDGVDDAAIAWDGETTYDVKEMTILDGDGSSRPPPRRRSAAASKTNSKNAVVVEEEEEEDDKNWRMDEDEDEDGSTAKGGSPAAGDTAPLSDDQSRLLKDHFPELAAEYDTEVNQEPLDEVFQDSARVASWKCVECGFKWKSGVFVRTCLRTKCPRCEEERNPRLGSRFIQLWEYSLNDPCLDPKTLTASSSKTVYWRCQNCGTSYQARIKDMVADKAKCPSCSLLNLHADLDKDENGLLQEWHPIKNGDLQPSQIKPTDRTKVWWLCMACGHEWEATFAARLNRSSRTKGKECPVCHGKGKY